MAMSPRAVIELTMSPNVEIPGPNLGAASPVKTVVLLPVSVVVLVVDDP